MPALSDPTFRVLLSSEPPAIGAANDDAPVAQAIKDFLVDQLSLGAGAAASRVGCAPAGGARSTPWHPMMGRGPMMHGFGAFGMFGGFRDLQVAVPLPDGQWLSFATALPASGPSFSHQFLLSMGIMAFIIWPYPYGPCDA